VAEGDVWETKWLGVLHRSAEGHERFLLVEADRTVAEARYERDGLLGAGRFTLWAAKTGKARDLWTRGVKPTRVSTRATGCGSGSRSPR